MIMLTLKPTGLGGSDDWSVLDADRREIGRIMLHPQAPPDRPWFWTVTARVPQHATEKGYAGSLDDAKAAFKAAWLRGVDPS